MSLAADWGTDSEAASVAGVGGGVGGFLLQAVRVPQGQYVCRSGDVGDSMYFINSGTVSVVVHGNEVPPPSPPAHQQPPPPLFPSLPHQPAVCG